MAEVAGLRSALDELRELAQGIHPAILAESGLRPALRTLARRSAVPVVIDVHTLDRLPEPVEATVYFVVSEALTNTAKHADASHVHLTLDTADGEFRLTISDDGIGGADPVRATAHG